MTRVEAWERFKGIDPLGRPILTYDGRFYWVGVQAAGTTEFKGHGPTPEAAIADAFGEALQQATSADAWEYAQETVHLCVEDGTFTSHGKPLSLVEWLNELGADGWEVVTCETAELTRCEDGTLLSYYSGLFKRRKA